MSLFIVFHDGVSVRINPQTYRFMSRPKKMPRRQVCKRPIIIKDGFVSREKCTNTFFPNPGGQYYCCGQCSNLSIGQRIRERNKFKPKELIDD